MFIVILMLLSCDFLSTYLILGWLMILVAHRFQLCNDSTHALLFVECRASFNDCFNSLVV